MAKTKKQEDKGEEEVDCEILKRGRRGEEEEEERDRKEN